MIDPSLLPRSAPGRPRLMEKQEGLLQAIEAITTANFNKSSADPRRRSSVIRSRISLDHLVEELKKRKFQIERTATYLRLIPRRKNSKQGKLHVETVPVKLVRAENNKMEKHEDAQFCFSLVDDLNVIASIFGPDECMVISLDNKANVKLGVVAANKQTAMCMHMDYQVRLPNHDFVVGAKHTLTPSVYAFLTVLSDRIGRQDAVTYTGPTVVRIRSGKHDTADSETHRFDLLEIMNSNVPYIQKITNTPQGSLKRILLLRADNGPDEAPRNPSTQKSMIRVFVKLELAFLFLISLPSGLSPYNPVERRMKYLSSEMTGTILDHEHFGSHLNSNRETVNHELELKNFQHCGEHLSKLFNEMVYDGFPTNARYVDPKEKPETFQDMTGDWENTHVRRSKYCLQIVMCGNPECCPNRPKHLMSLLRPILPNGFIPPPSKLATKFNEGNFPLQLKMDAVKDRKIPFVPLGLRVLYPTEAYTPFDSLLPSMQSKIKKCICDQCKIQFPSFSQMLVHRRSVHKFSRYRDIEIDTLISMENDRRLDKIQTVMEMNPNSKEYKVLFEDGTVDWVTIVADAHPKVQAFRSANSVNIEVYTTESASWMNPTWVNVD